MHSPMKNQYNKKTRKPTTFSQPAAQTEVGEFKSGYFVMPDTASYDRRNNSKQERSPGRRKHQTNNESNATSSPNNKERTSTKFDQDYTKKPHNSTFIEITKEPKKQELLTPASLITPMKMYNYDSPPTKTPHSPSNKDSLSTSPTSSGRWAGPAFGNAPHPSMLPLPEFPLINAATTTSPIPISVPAPYHPSVAQFFSLSPPGDNTCLHTATAYGSPPTYHPVHYSSMPQAIPFPYVGPPVLPASTASLAHLSADLRRLLNINDLSAGAIMHDPIMVANSS